MAVTVSGCDENMHDNNGLVWSLTLLVPSQQVAAPSSPELGPMKICMRYSTPFLILYLVLLLEFFEFSISLATHA